MANEFGELPHFACHGMLARTHAVQHVLSEKMPGERLGVEDCWSGLRAPIFSVHFPVMV